MADAFTDISSQQNGSERDKVRIQRRLPKATLMDCILRTPLKSLRRSSNFGTSILPATPPSSTRVDKKRKFRSSSGTSNENTSFGGFTEVKTSTRNARTIMRGRRIHSEPTSSIQARNHATQYNSIMPDEPMMSPLRLTKRPRLDPSLLFGASHVSDDDIFMKDSVVDDVDLGLELHQLQLDEMSTATNATHEASVPPSLHELIRNMKHSLDVERKARRKAEENHLNELRKRIEMEKLVEKLQGR